MAVDSLLFNLNKHQGIINIRLERFFIGRYIVKCLFSEECAYTPPINRTPPKLASGAFSLESGQVLNCDQT